MIQDEQEAREIKPGMGATPTTTQNTEQDIETDAARMLLALDALVTIEAPQFEIAEKYAMRLRFARERLAELKSAASSDGGAFAPARVEVATSILETNVQTAAAFVNRTLRRARRTPGRRSVQAVVDEAVATIEERAQRAA